MFEEVMHIILKGSWFIFVGVLLFGILAFIWRVSRPSGGNMEKEIAENKKQFKQDRATKL